MLTAASQWVEPCWRVMGQVVWCMLAGTVAFVMAAIVGWHVAGRSPSPTAQGRSVAVRVIAWWIRRIVLPLVRTESFFRRACGIFLNNATVMAPVVARGCTRWTAWCGVALVGASLGMGFRVLSTVFGEWSGFASVPSRGRAWRMHVGMLANMLEPAAIVISLGLCLGQAELRVPPSWRQVWQCFGVVVVPLLVAAAWGEALWLGAGTVGQPPGDADQSARS